MKYVFFSVLLIQALIHLAGAAKAFGYGHISRLTQTGKPAGVLWLLAALLFTGSAILFVFQADQWPLITAIAVILSQALIIRFWKDAKWGTGVNLVILLAAFIHWSDARFQKMVKRESAELLATVAVREQHIVSADMIRPLPAMVQQWLTRSGVIGKEDIYFVRLQQKGQLRNEPGAGWLPFTATQYFTPQQPAFIWNTRVQMMPLVFMNGRDKFTDGRGEMQIKVLSVFNVVDEQPGNAINQSTLQRYLGEICWFPAAALNSYVQWEAIDSFSAKATMQYKTVMASGIFTFNSEGDMTRFCADRYYGGGPTARLEKWLVEPTAYNTFQGIRIPSSCKVSWQLQAGAFNWLNLEITAIDYNRPELYP